MGATLFFFLEFKVNYLFFLMSGYISPQQKYRMKNRDKNIQACRERRLKLMGTLI
jgi:hypothetical protein